MAEDDSGSASLTPSGEQLAERRRSTRADRASPVELASADIDSVRPLWWTSSVIALATAILLVTNAISLDGWVAEQPPSAEMAKVSAASEAWLGATEATGLAAPRAALHGVWLRAEAARFPGQAADEGR